MNNLRNERQAEFSKAWLESDRFNILNLCPRFGKCYVAINILESYPLDAKVLITYPSNKIRTSWEDDFKKRNYVNPNIVYSTHLSLKKLIDEEFDLIIIDEVHLLSDAQILECEKLFVKNKHVLGLTGTLSKWTARVLREDLGLEVLITYPISKGIEEGVIPDYEIVVIKVPLDDKMLQMYGNKHTTEKRKFNGYSYVIDKMQDEGKNTKFLRLSRMRLVQNSIAKLNKTRRLLSLHQKERILVFCGTIKIADNLGIPSYHSKSLEKETFQNFVDGKINHLSVVKIGNTGVTYTPLNRVIINSFDSNSENMAQKILRCMSMEYDNPEKKAKIIIISSTEEIENRWLRKSLEFF